MSAPTKRPHRPRTTLHLAALLSATLIACALVSTHESTTASAARAATNPPDTTHPSDLHARDLIAQCFELPPAEPATQPPHPEAPNPDNFLADIYNNTPNHWAHITTLPDTHILHHPPIINQPPQATPQSLERLSIRPLQNSSTAYTRNALMLEGHDRLAILARPNEPPAISIPSIESFTLPHTILLLNPPRWPAPPPTPTNPR